MPGDIPLYLQKGRAGATERAYQALVRQLELRQVLPGEKLPAAQVLAATIGVNRPAVLQALQRMQDEGRVDVGAGRKGVVVLGPEQSRAHRELVATTQDWAELGTLIEIIEPGIARVVARQGLSAEVVGEARELIASIGGTRDPQALLGLDHKMHLLLGRSTGMQTLEALGTLSRQLIAQAMDLVDGGTKTPARLAREHELLLTAILAGNAGAAADLADKHLAGVRKALSSLTDRSPATWRTAQQ